MKLDKTTMTITVTFLMPKDKPLGMAGMESELFENISYILDNNNLDEYDYEIDITNKSESVDD